MVDAPLPSFWPPAAAVAAPGQQQQEPPPPPTTVLCPGPSPPAGGRKRDREQPSLWPHGSSGETGAVVGAGRHARQGSTSSLANGLGGLELGLGAAEEEDGGEAEEEVEAAILTGQAIKRLRIEAPTSSFLSPPAFAAASAGYGGEQHVGPYDQHQGHAVPPSPLPPQPSSQPFAPLRLGRPGGSSSGAADAGAGAGSWAAIRRLGISAPNSTTPGAAPASAFGAGFGGPEAPAAGGVLAGGVLPRTSLFAVARAHSSGSSALHPRSTAGEAETPSPRLARGHGRGSGSGSSGGGGLTRSLSDPCLHSPTAASTAGSLSAAAHSGSGGSWGPAPSGDGDVAAGASGSTPTGHSFFRAGPDALRHAGEGGGGGVMGLGGPSPGVMQDDADVDYSLINSMLGRLHFASRARCCRDTPQQQQQEQQPPERLAPGLQRGAGEAAGGLGRSRQQQPANKKGD